jgi:hypothetical protein
VADLEVNRLLEAGIRVERCLEFVCHFFTGL